MEIADRENEAVRLHANKRQINVAVRRNPLRSINEDIHHNIPTQKQQIANGVKKALPVVEKPAKVEPMPKTRALATTQKQVTKTSGLPPAPKKDVSQNVEPMDISIIPSSEINDGPARLPTYHPPHIRNIDVQDSDNPQLVSEYVNDIYNYLWDLEDKYPVRPKHLQIQTEVTPRMRSVLVNWMVQIHQKFRMLQETLYLSVALVDRFLQDRVVRKDKLQLVGVGAMFIASKVEELFAPELADFVYITDNAYSRAEILKIETVILRTLSFNLGRPLPIHFLRRNSKAGNVDQNMHLLAKYLIELTLVDYEFASIRPSLVAAGAIYLAICLLEKPQSPWNVELQYYSGYTASQARAVACKISQLVLKASLKTTNEDPKNAVYTKYCSKKFMSVATCEELKNPIIKEMALQAN